MSDQPTPPVTPTRERIEPDSGPAAWYVYLLRCADGSLYTGITTELHRRLRQHNGQIKGGARYTRVRRPVSLVWYQSCASRSMAAQEEYRVRTLPRPAKLRLADEPIHQDERLCSPG